MGMERRPRIDARAFSVPESTGQCPPPPPPVSTNRKWMRGCQEGDVLEAGETGASSWRAPSWRGRVGAPPQASFSPSGTTA